MSGDESSWLGPGKATFARGGGDKGPNMRERSSGVLDVVIVSVEAGKLGDM